MLHGSCRKLRPSSTGSSALGLRKLQQHMVGTGGGGGELGQLARLALPALSLRGSALRTCLELGRKLAVLLEFCSAVNGCGE